MPAPPAVLLVDDDPTAQLIALSMLRHLGIEADAASDGAAGARMASERAYDVILMDVQLPVLDGVEAIRSIRAAPGGDRPHIVAVTERALPDGDERMAKVGVDRVLPKPLSIAGLRDAVGRLPRPEPVEAVTEAPEAGAVEALMAQVRAHVHDLLGEEDEAFVADLVESFAASARTALARVAAARAEGNAAALATVAHALKGSAANVGLSALADAWSVIETSARLGDPALFGAPLAAAVAQTQDLVGVRREA
jgi:CheY-like chemotaxis protein